MARIRPVTKFNSYTYEALASWLQDQHDALSTHVGVFASPPVSLADIQTAVDDMRAAITAWGVPGNRGSKADLVTLRTARNAAREIIRSLCGYVDGIAAGDENIILMAAQVPSSFPTPFGVLPAPQDVRQLFSKHTPDGFYRLRWKKVKGSVAYYVFFSVDSNPSNKSLVTTVRETAATFELPNTPSLSLRYFWVQPIGGDNGLGNISDVCTAYNR